MEITQKNIHFLDNYFKNNDVIYYHIRMEMLDHALSGIENEMKEKNIDFYEAFKIYMPIHKNQLLKANKQSLLESITVFLKSLTNLYTIYVAGFTILICTIFKEHILALNSIFWFLMLFYVIISLGIYFVNGRKKYYVLEKNGQILNVIYFINIVLNGYTGNFFGEFHGKIYTVGLILFLSFSFFVHYVKTIIKFNKSNKMIVAQ